jgi:ApaG protein
MQTDVLASFFQHTAVTAGVTVRVAVNYMPEQSRVEASRWFWVYHIRIENHRGDTVQLLARHWRISDALGAVNIVEGEGVVGETPVLVPGQSHDYVSGCELHADHGAMQGHYTFVDEAGEAFLVAIPRFPLAVPAEAG